MPTALLLDDIELCNNLVARQIKNGPLPIDIVAKCTTVAQVYEYLIQHPLPDLIFTDYYLSSCTGLYLVESLQRQDRYQSIEFILISGATPDQLPDFDTVELAGYIEKPVSRYSYGVFVKEYGYQWM